MASIWFETKGVGARKVVGNLTPRRAIDNFRKVVEDAALKLGAHVEYRGRIDAILKKEGMADQLCYVELNSPPSAPEPNQPKRLDDGAILPKGSPLPRGVLVYRGGINYMGTVPHGEH